VEYAFSNGRERFALDAKTIIERFNFSEQNAQLPSLSVEFKELMEKGSVALVYDVKKQSTRATEFNDSGVIELVATDKTTTNGSVSWQLMLSPVDVLTFTGSEQQVVYESKNFADLSNNMLGANWRHGFTERLILSIGVQAQEYVSTYERATLIAPIYIQGYNLCPPNYLLVSETACWNGERVLANVKDVTQSNTFQAGIEWKYSQTLSIKSAAGVVPTHTIQYSETPIIPVTFGQPINQSLDFGGLKKTDSHSQAFMGSLGFEGKAEVFTYEFSLEDSLQPSSTGALLDARKARLNCTYLYSPYTQLNISSAYTQLQRLDENIEGAALDRDVYEFNVKISHRNTESLMTIVSFGARHQKDNMTGVVAEAEFGSIAITYMPHHWTW
jgi:hypothetical protein